MSEQKKSNAGKKSWVYSAVRGVCWALTRFLLPLRVVGEEKLQREGAFIAVANHLCLLDPVMIAVPVRDRQVCFVAKKELQKVPVLGWMIRKANGIFVDRHNSDMEAMRACMKVLREGNILGIFPEGTRHHQGLMTELESGVALMALRSKAPLVPMYIPGKLKLFRTLTVYVGDPIPTEDLIAQGVNSQTCQALLERISAAYQTLSEQK